MQSHRNFLLSCDWGTTSFRLRLVDADHLNVVAELILPDGIKETFQDWERQTLNSNIGRREYFQARLKKNIQLLEQNSGLSLEKLPCVLSGMASSSIGMEELPYALLPFPVDGTGACVRSIEENASFSHEILLVSGIRSDCDVMRGEEAQLVGLLELKHREGKAFRNATFIFPGTHSKHITIRNHAVTTFRTYMTGELFHLLGNYSILQQTIRPDDPVELLKQKNLDAFSMGLKAGAGQMLLHSLFMVRTNGLFAKMDREQNYFYLSGLLIGSELYSLNKDYEFPLVVSAAPNLSLPYQIAMEELRFKNRVFIDPAMAEQASVAGHVVIYKQHKANLLLCRK